MNVINASAAFVAVQQEEVQFHAFCRACDAAGLARAERLNVSAIGQFRVKHLAFSPAMLRWFFDEGYTPEATVAEIYSSN